MVRSVTINRESWCIDGLRFNIVLQPFLNKNCPTTQSLSCRGLVTVMAKKGIAPPKTQQRIVTNTKRRKTTTFIIIHKISIFSNDRVALLQSSCIQPRGVRVQRHIFQLYPGKSPQVTSFCVFQCLVWQLDRSEVMGSGLFWFLWVTAWVKTRGVVCLDNGPQVG